MLKLGSVARAREGVEGGNGGFLLLFFFFFVMTNLVPCSAEDTTRVPRPGAASFSQPSETRCTMGCGLIRNHVGNLVVLMLSFHQR